jgi:type VI secretion system secreted protein VgrG
LAGEARAGGREAIFQDRTALEIALSVLDEGGVAYRKSLTGKYLQREYCVQYRETDLDFASRLLEEEGIFYFFEHGKGTHTLVLGDARSACPSLPGGTRISYRDEQGMVPGEEAFTAFGGRRRTRPSGVVLRDVNYLTPQLDLTASAGEGKGEQEVYDHHGRYGTPEVGQALAKVRLEEAQAKAAQWSGRSTSRRLCPGYVFELARCPDGGMDGEYLVVSVTHRGDQPEALAGVQASGKSGYQSRAVCLRKEIPYRPERRTAQPKIAGWQTAVVVGPAGEEIHTDEHGRVRVQLNWDREGKEDEKSSCWIRVAQALAGPGFGALWLPRVGQEVLVSFEDGDPDRPLILGAAYNGMNTTPLDLPAEKTKSTLKSRSSPGDGGIGFNELRFEDAAGSEEVYLHAQKDLKIEVLNDKGQEVGGNEKLLVAKDRSRTV